MKAFAANPGKRSFGVVDHPRPAIETATQVKLRMLEIGICGTDKEICAFEYGTPPPGSDYLVLGHESVGEVVEAGGGVTAVKPGDIVVPTVRRPCGKPECVPCEAGRQDFCTTGAFVERGIKEAHGFLAEYVVEEEQYLTVAPADLRDVAVLVEPLTIAEKAVTQLWQVQQRLPWACRLEPGREGAYCHNALVLGAGPVGLLGAMKLALEGFRTFVFSKLGGIEAKRRIVEAIGATLLDADRISLAEASRAAGGFDVVYEAVGASALAFEALKTLDQNAAFIFTGVPGRRGPVPVDTDALMRNLVLRNQVVFGTVNAGKQSFADAIHDLREFRRRWPEAVDGLITGRFRMEDAAGPLTGAVGGIKNVVTLV
jgi:threonine dehydrogenase-like Zn-dependent dehydrogenase